MTTETTTAPRGSLYGDLWRRVPKEVAYLFIAFPISIAGFAVTIGLFSAGAGTIITFFIGVVLAIAALYVARGFGTLEVNLLEWTGRAPIKRPEWQDARARTGFFPWLRAVLGNGHYWLYLLHTMIIDFPLKTISWSIMITWVATGLGGISFWFWNSFIPNGDQQWNLSTWLLHGAISAADVRLADNIIYFVLGVIFLATLPFITRALTAMHWLVARGVLAAFRSDALEREVATLSESRGAAISAEGHSLRRLERDIHDGPQQRLVRLQMDLAAAERQLDADPEKARGLIAEAMEQSKEALEELRSLSRGFAPPILLDRGLVAALESAAVRSTVPTRVVSELPEGTDLPQEIERNAYFVASEALANAAKHSGATSIELRVALRRLPEPDETWLDVIVSDDGKGGATTVAGHGLSGLEERLRGLGGTLEVTSPAGGPTVISAHVPVTTSARGSTD
ncbi:MAG: sensor histidine kinase [Rhodoglobus sp.]